jgi:hypothetical protein
MRIKAAAAMEMLDGNFGPLDSQDISEVNTLNRGNKASNNDSSLVEKRTGKERSSDSSRTI